MTGPGVWVIGPATELPAEWHARATPVLLVRVPPAELAGLARPSGDDAEARFFALAARGASRAQIARDLGVSVRTVDRWFAAARARLGVGTNAEAAVRLSESGW